jgi:hypothetical protein
MHAMFFPYTVPWVKQQPEDDSLVESKHVVRLNEQQKVTFTSL